MNDADNSEAVPESAAPATTPARPGAAAHTAHISRRITFPAPSDAPAHAPQAEAEHAPDFQPEPAEPAAPAPEASAETPAGRAPERVVERVEVQRRGGFIPGFLGGVAAVVGGLFAAPYVMPESLRPLTAEDRVAIDSSIGEVSASIDALSSRVEEIAQSAVSPDAVQAVADDLAAARDSLGQDLGAFTASLEDVDARLTTIETAPVEDNPDPAVTAALNQYRDAVAGFEDSVDELRSSVEAQVAAALAAADDTRAQAAAEAEAAAERAAQAARQQAMADIRAALDSGAPYADALATLDGVDVPAALSGPADSGVATLAALQEDFGPAARAALAAAREAMPAGEGAERIGNFLSAQFGMRSLSAKEGDAPDAVLGRAQEAVTNGDLQTALDEIAALPDAAMPALSDWVAQATTRTAAVAAATDLAATLTAN